MNSVKESAYPTEKENRNEKIENNISDKAKNEKSNYPKQNLAIEFMLIAQKKLSEDVFSEIRDQAAMNIVKLQK